MEVDTEAWDAVLKTIAIVEPLITSSTAVGALVVGIIALVVSIRANGRASRFEAARAALESDLVEIYIVRARQSGHEVSIRLQVSNRSRTPIAVRSLAVWVEYGTPQVASEIAPSRVDAAIAPPFSLEGRALVEGEAIFHLTADRLGNQKVHTQRVRVTDIDGRNWETNYVAS